uniref:G_PROTEIN_RECEP_F1_2 domain-containing protein n=1 Tax=Macrostomum lignano TaxID=282301 RepID=A0A1I8J088_9PLAT
HWVFGIAICNIWLSLDVLYCTASIWSLVVIAFDRFTATAFPIWYREQRKVRRFGCYSLFIWLLSGLICLPHLVGWNGKKFINPIEKFKKSLVRIDNSSDAVQCDLFNEKNYVLYSATGSFILPLVVMIDECIATESVCEEEETQLQQRQQHAKRKSIVQQVFQSRRHQQQHGNPESHHHQHQQHIQRADQREQRATQRMLIIIVIFIVCWMPFTLMYLIRGLTSDSGSSDGDGTASKIVEVVQELAIWLGYANSGLNPILYTIFNKDFRLAFKKLTMCRS